jgi:hypothetical protein
LPVALLASACELAEALAAKPFPERFPEGPLPRAGLLQVAPILAVVPLTTGGNDSEAEGASGALSSDSKRELRALSRLRAALGEGRVVSCASAAGLEAALRGEGKP